ncbi:MAG TPA: DUF883 domain-containing protein [Methylomirabilota bacterium]|nr:DUF883 domain-containing protein [Methylomirabilota bacterium]
MDTPRTREDAQDALESITDQIQEGISSGKYSLQEIQSMLVDKTKAAAQETDRLVHENPWAAIGIAAGIGLALGLLLPRK